MIGKKITLTYDARPWMELKQYKAEVIRETKTGFKIKNLDERGRYESELFYPNGTVRGFNTLTWRFSK